MARLPRVVAVDAPHHVTQRGNARQVILATDADRLTYTSLLREYAVLDGLSLLGYCLMSNHVHLVVVPHTEMALSHCLRQVVDGPSFTLFARVGIHLTIKKGTAEAVPKQDPFDPRESVAKIFSLLLHP